MSARLLDLFCGAGGAARGYADAGFDVVGVDIKPQPHYPFAFVQGDALRPPVRLEDFDAIHASPPCQHYTAGAKAASTSAGHPDLYDLTRQLLLSSGRPWVIENVIGAPYRHGFVLCGSMFGLRVQRHRNFETSEVILSPFVCDHRERPVTITGSGSVIREGIRDYAHSRHASNDMWPALMGMPWATPREVAEAIPPAYTEYLGRQLLDRLSLTPRW